MAERYAPGSQRIFYRAANFTTGLIVKVNLIDPDLNNEITILLGEVDEERVPGLYYFDYIFYEGNYIAYFYEDGVLKWSQAYSIRRNVSGSRSRPFLGPNVINT